MPAKKVWGLVFSLAAAFALHQAYHWLEKEWSTAILSEGDDEVSVDSDELESSKSTDSDESTENGEAHQNQFGVPGPI